MEKAREECRPARHSNTAAARGERKILHKTFAVCQYRDSSEKINCHKVKREIMSEKSVSSKYFTAELKAFHIDQESRLEGKDFEFTWQQRAGRESR